jgi:hypothetical protein
MKNKQTATEYFYDRVISIFTKYHEEDVPTIDFGKLITEAFEQAKEMEKGQIMAFAKLWEEKLLDGRIDNVDALYNETHKP